MPNHDNIPIWDVEISVIGPVTAVQFQLNTRKELEHPDPFYSNVRVIDSEYGFLATVSAFGPTAELAQNAAILWFGRMLDLLVLRLNLPLQLDLNDSIILRSYHEKVKRQIDINDFKFAFRESRIFSLEQSTYLRALSWFRKAKYSKDPFDKFLALWNSIETVASKYNPNKEACKEKGSICHIWESFKSIWGECENWKIIGGKDKWLDEGNEIRKNIAHGIIPVEISSIQTIMDKLPVLDKVAHQFLEDFFGIVRPKITPKLINKLR